jgi:hypothetical protein
LTVVLQWTLQHARTKCITNIWIKLWDILHRCSAGVQVILFAV